MLLANSIKDSPFIICFRQSSSLSVKSNNSNKNLRNVSSTSTGKTVHVSAQDVYGGGASFLSYI